MNGEFVNVTDVSFVTILGRPFLKNGIVLDSNNQN